MQKYTRWLLLVMLMLALVACDSGDDGGDNGDSGAAPNDDTPSQTTALPENITTNDALGGTLSVNYPAGWVSQEFGGAAALANDAAVFEESAEQIEAGQVFGNLLVLPEEMLAALDMGDDPTPADILNNFIDTTTSEDPQASFDMSEPQTTTIDGREVVTRSGSATDASGTSDVAFLMVDGGDAFVLLSFLASEGEIGDYLDTLNAIAAAVTYTIPAADG